MENCNDGFRRKTRVVNTPTHKNATLFGNIVLVLNCDNAES